MDLLLIARKVWLYRVATLPVLALTFLAAFYVVAIKDPEYKATSNYVLINPPPPPSQEDIAVNPALGRIKADNPYTRFADQSAVVGLLVSRLSDESTREALSEEGADPRYTVAPSTEFSTQSLLVEITGVGATPEQAIGTAAVVGTALVSELDGLQASRGVDPRYRIDAQSVTAPENAQRQVSSTLRPLVAVIVLGGILLFVVVSAGEALTTLRQERRAQAPNDGKDRRGVNPSAAAKPAPRNGNGAQPRRGKRGSRGKGKRKPAKGRSPNNGGRQDESRANGSLGADPPRHAWKRRGGGAGSKA